MTLDSLPDLEYKPVVSCKDSFHATDVLAVSEHGAPGRRPNISVMGRAEKGLVITTGSFTRDARQEATRDGATAIDLIDGELLAEKLKKLGLGVRKKMVEAVGIDEEWFASV